MERKILTSLVIYGLFVSALNAYTFSSGTALDIYSGGIINEEILIDAGGVYSLSKLRSISGDGITIKLEKSNSADHENIILSVDDSFISDNLFVTNVFNQETGTIIMFADSFLNSDNIDSSNLLQFNSINLNIKQPYVREETASGDYVYNWNVAGKSIYRQYSAEYLAAHQEGAGLTGISSIVQYTPHVLLRPVSTINQHELFDVYNFTDDYFVSVVPEYYNARDFNDMGLRLNAGTKVMGRLFVGASAYLSTANFKYGVDDFDYVIYGGNLRFLYELNDVLFLRGVGGVSVAKIKSDIANNPNIFSSYAGADMGAKFGFESGLYLSPFVGFGTTNAHVLGVHDNVYLLHTGTDVGFKYFLDGVTYSYNLRAGVNTGGYVDASLGIDAWTVADKIGGGVSIGVVDTEFGWSGKFSANVRFAF